ncbi:MAG: helix-turn-helix domain-containing protein, partial [Lachnospiraceae bacterium]|nr:helix-turn-helix domain-containing protein [Lachnospiraceae bacterium]
MSEKKNLAYKYRIYPNAEQQELFAKAFGCTRFVYNTLLEEKKKHYEETGKSLRNTPAHLKADYEWLKEVDSLALS